MSVTLTTNTRNVACNSIVDLIDGGAGDTTGDLAFATAGVSVLAACDFSDPAFGNSVAGIATADTISDGTVAGSSNPSVIALALFRNKSNTEIFRCSVGTSGADINLTNTSVNDGDTISITSLTVTVPAS